MQRFLHPCRKCSSSSLMRRRQKFKTKARSKQLLNELPSLEDHIPKTQTPNSFNSDCRVDYDIIQSAGEMKRTDVPLPDKYWPGYVEAQWYSWWKLNKCSPSVIDDKVFSMCLPPPNITGKLHMGHALTISIQDSLARWYRMNGYSTLWIPGVDHAGISTQVVVEKKLRKETGLSRHDLGRVAFVEEVRKWKSQKCAEVCSQIERLGASVDWEKFAFTMDNNYCEAVTEAFIRLHKADLIYRDRQLVNWSCSLRSAVSDIEVDLVPVPAHQLLSIPGYEDPVEFGILEYFDYPIEHSHNVVTVATTRLETLLGDVAVAINKEDPRYSALQGQYVIHPLTKQRLPIICDDSVKFEFGTGAVKVTPGHDYRDFVIGQKHDLPPLSVLDDHGCISAPDSQFHGLPRFLARSRIREFLKESGFYRKREAHTTVMPVCSRSGDVIEPMLKEQWFMRMSAMSKRAVKAADDGELRFSPSFHSKLWREWLKDHDTWCLSRQIWWGHRIPAYRATRGDQTVWIVAADEETATDQATTALGGLPDAIEQDEDVLDTWFSSAIFPLASLGWPRQSPPLRSYYPNSIVETGKDILFFWVARMVMVCAELSGHLPFPHVLLHSIIRDGVGRKMSKSLGNVVDPLDFIDGVTLPEMNASMSATHLSRGELSRAVDLQGAQFPNGLPECGADTLRFGLCSLKLKGDDINLDVHRIVEFRKFCNKIWQGCRFVLGCLSDSDTTDVFHLAGTRQFPNRPTVASDGFVQDLCLEDRWILSRLSSTVDAINCHFEAKELHLVTQDIVGFWKSEFCDIYVESVKPRLRSDCAISKRQALCCLLTCTETVLRLLSPLMPFLAEELWQRFLVFVPESRESKFDSVTTAKYPVSRQFQFKDPGSELLMGKVLAILATTRRLLDFYQAKPAFISVSSNKVPSSCSTVLKTLLHTKGHVSIDAAPPRRPGTATCRVDGDCTVTLDLGTVALDAGFGRRVEKRMLKIQRMMMQSGRRSSKLKDVSRMNILELELEGLRATLANLA